MSSPLFKSLGNKGPSNNPMSMISQFNQFKNSFKGNPRDKVQELLNSGKMTQEQYNQLSGMAQQFMRMLGK